MIDSITQTGGAPADLHRTPRRKPARADLASVDRLPPHSPEAEQGVLGCVLLSPNECMGVCIEKLKEGAEVFYDLRHQTIYPTLAEMYEYEIKLFVVDYLQLLHSTARRAENRQQEIADISSGIKSLAKELNVPIIVLSQLNRELEREKNRKPRLSDLRESGAIEQDADVVGLLYKPSSGDDEESGSPAAEEDAEPVNLLIAKQRNGPTGYVNLTFLKSYTRFESAAKVSEEDVPD